VKSIIDHYYFDQLKTLASKNQFSLDETMQVLDIFLLIKHVVDGCPEYNREKVKQQIANYFVRSPLYNLGLEIRMISNQMNLIPNELRAITDVIVQKYQVS